MGLITKQIEITLSPQWIKWFTEKGYDIPRKPEMYKDSKGNLRPTKRMRVPRGTKLIVNVEDLPPYSELHVDIQCDYCEEIYDVPYSSYVACNHDGKCYCQKRKSKVFLSGDKSPNWKAWLTDEYRTNKRMSTEYKEFIQKVLARDNYTCQITHKGRDEVELEVHHLNSYDWCVEGRCDPKNAITLSVEMHRMFHSLYGNGNNTKEQFLEFCGLNDLILEDYNGEIPTARAVYCYEEQKMYHSASEFAAAKSLNRSTVRNNLNKKFRLHKIKEHIFWYDEYLKMTEEEIQARILWNDTKPKKVNINNRKMVICTTTMEIFESISFATDYYSISSVTHILNVCKRKKGHITCGKLPNGTPLKWDYLDVYISEHEIKDMDDFISKYLVTDKERMIA